MALRNPQLKALRDHRVPAWWPDAKLGIFVHWTPASVPAFAPVDVDIGELVQSGRRDALAFVAVRGVVRELAALPRQSRSPRHHREVYGNRPYAEFADEWEAGLEQWDPARVGGAVRRDRRALRRVRHQAHGRLLHVADRRAQPAPRGLELPARRRRRAGRSGARRGDALRPLLLGRARLDVRTTGRSDRWRRCSTRFPAATIPRTPTRRCAS